MCARDPQPPLDTQPYARTDTLESQCAVYSFEHLNIRIHLILSQLHEKNAVINPIREVGKVRQSMFENLA